MKAQSRAYLLAGLAILCWSTVSTAFKIALKYFTVIGLVFVSSAFAALFLLIIIIIRTYLLPDRDASLLNPAVSLRTNISKSLIPALLNPFAYYLVLFAAYDRLRAQEAQVLNYTWAIVLSVLAIIYMKQKFRYRDFIALAISFFAVILISTRGSLISMKFDDLPGSSLAVGSSFIWAAYWMIGMKESRPILTRLFWNFLLGSLYIGIYLAFRFMLTGALGILISDVSLAAIGSGLYVGLFEMGLTFLIWNKALQLSPSTAKIANLIFLTPIISLVFISAILNESIHPSTLIGLSLIILSNVWQNFRSPRQLI
ncbi:MAG: DMT family transporter [Candidatus Cloacimonetes bacterium]|nr:DMT family transporter [Candidatus Cloacimonadota bacterium]